MTAPARITLEDQVDGAPRLVLSGSFLVADVAALDHDLRAIEAASVIDISALDPVDTTGAWVVFRLSRDLGAPVEGASEGAQRLIAAVNSCDDHVAIVPPELPVQVRVPETVGASVVELALGTRELLGFLGGLVVAFGGVLVSPRRLRLTALVRQMELVGVNALFIIGMMSFLVGIVIAQQGSVQLQQFGAEIYTINLTGRLAFRELGVLMTAIMVAGRSGSAFAAQIGTMKLTEEVDAMRTIGLNPMEVLVLPRVIACVVMMTLLGFYAAVVAIIGGAVLAQLGLGIPFLTFMSRIKEVVPELDLWVGLLKGPVFGLIIGLAGCYQGMKVEGNSEDVGRRTTKAVVQGIFMVIVLDAFFAIFFSKIGWI
ncbi:MAG: ABC transporter permease [Sphingomonadales bacterium]|nr:ABC transporter permease [Sphingomonadales bacterium]MDE2168271.1 ABC transporter permease [Sphingomonadales bacterium]